MSCQLSREKPCQQYFFLSWKVHGSGQGQGQGHISLTGASPEILGWKIHKKICILISITRCHSKINDFDIARRQLLLSQY
jgi:hypothetical protein